MALRRSTPRGVEPHVFPERLSSASARVETLRVPPHSVDAEQSVLGGLMLVADSWDRVADKLTEEDFYRRDHRLIFRAIAELADKGKPFDAVTLGEWLETRGLSDDAGGSAYVIELASTTPSAANIEAYAEIVREKSILRQLIDVGTAIVNDGYQPEGRASAEVLETAETRVFHIAEAGMRGRKGFLPMRKAVKDAFELLQQRYANRGELTGLPSGFRDLDQMTGGLQASDLIIVAARPAMGKCVAHDTEIVLADGSVVTIEEIMRHHRGTPIATLGDDLRFVPVVPSDYIDDGIKPLFELVTALGRRVETTATHPYLTLDGWKPLTELRVGDRIAVPRVMHAFGNESMRSCEVRLLAYLIGDGGLTGSVPKFTNTNTRICDDFEDAVQAFGGIRSVRSEHRAGMAMSWRLVSDAGQRAAARGRFADAFDGHVQAHVGTAAALASGAAVSAASISHWRHGATVPNDDTFGRVCSVLGIEGSDFASTDIQSLRRNAPNRLTSWLRQQGLMGCGSATKHVPAAVFRLCRSDLALFLNRLFATDGWASTLASGQVQIGYASVSERLARQLQHLLLRFGIVARLRQRWVRYRETRRASWQLEITDADSIRTFAAEIGIHGKEAALENALVALSARAAHSNVDGLPAAIWMKLEHAKGPLSWAELARRAGVPASNLHVGKRGLSRARLARFAMVLGDAELAALASSELCWDRVESIVYTGDRQVYDLTVPDTHNFVANDICVHNTSLALNMAQHAAIKTKKAAAVFSMEMSAPQLAFRLISSLGRVDQTRLRSGQLEDEDWPRVTSAITLLSDAKIFIDDTPGLSPIELRSRARRLAREHDLGVIVIDYLQLMSVPGNKENRATEISEISRSLKGLAKELNVPVIALSQLNRSLESRTDKKPVMADLRESGAIEQDADMILFIYRDEYYNKESAEKGVAEIIIGKHRNGPTGSLKLAFLGQYTLFADLARDEYRGSFE